MFHGLVRFLAPCKIERKLLGQIIFLEFFHDTLIQSTVCEHLLNLNMPEDCLWNDNEITHLHSWGK